MKTSIFILLIICAVLSGTSAQNPQSHKAQVDSGKAVQKDTSKSVQKITILSPPTTMNGSDSIELLLVGNGDVQKAISDGSKFEANTGVGVIFRRYWLPEKTIQGIEFECNINVFSTADTLKTLYENDVLMNRRQFGNYLLLPKSSRQAADVKFSLYLGNYKTKPLAHILSGFHSELLGSNTLWATEEKNVNVSAFAFKAGIFHDFIPDNIRREKKYSIRVGLNYAYRKIRGDIAAQEYDQLRAEILGSEELIFRGLETTMSFKLNNITAEFQIPLLGNKLNAVPGLTGTQMITSISFSGGVPLEVFNKNKTTTDIATNR